MALAHDRVSLFEIQDKLNCTNRGTVLLCKVCKHLTKSLIREDLLHSWDLIPAKLIIRDRFLNPGT